MTALPCPKLGPRPAPRPRRRPAWRCVLLAPLGALLLAGALSLAKCACGYLPAAPCPMPWLDSVWLALAGGLAGLILTLGPGRSRRRTTRGTACR